MDDDVGWRDLLEELRHGVRKRSGAKRRRGAERDHIRAAAGVALGRGRGFHLDRASLSRRDVPNVGAEQSCKQRVRRRAVGCGAIGDEHTSQAQPGCGRRRHARVIRLHAAAGDERIGLPREGIGGHEPHLSHLVAAKREPNGVVALDEQARSAAERSPQSWHLLDRRRLGREWHGG